MHTQFIYALAADPEMLARLVAAADLTSPVARTVDGGPIDACLTCLHANLEFYGRMLMASFQS